VALQAAFGGGGFVPDSDRSEVSVSVEAPPGSSLEYTRFASENVARQVRTHPEVAYTYTTVGSASGTGAVDAAKRVRAPQGPGRARRVAAAAGRVAPAGAAAPGGVTAYLLESGGPGGGQKQLQLQLTGPEGATLGRLAAQVQEVVRRTPARWTWGCRARARSPSCAST
jgi:HAE1 family hydrophobic/amphiphilic exporter-1